MKRGSEIAAGPVGRERGLGRAMGFAVMRVADAAMIVTNFSYIVPDGHVAWWLV